MTTLEGNKLICEFMGLVGYNEKGHPHEYGYYHESWNYLMPVVEKIRVESDGYIIEHGTNNLFEIKLATTTIQQVWNACIGFIQWYISTHPSLPSGGEVK